MPNATRHEEIEEEFRDMLATAGLPQPDDVAHMRRVLVFLWYESKAFVLVDLSSCQMVPTRSPALTSRPCATM
jgi:hypothetical protein